MNGKLVTRFAAIYAGLALVVIGAGLGAYAFHGVHKIEHRVAKVEASLGDQNLTRLADAYINQQATAHGLSVVKIVVVRVDTEGDAAKVTAKVTLTDGVTQQATQLVVTFRRGVWNAQGLATA